jgi:hypothetical protein
MRLGPSFLTISIALVVFAAFPISGQNQGLLVLDEASAFGRLTRAAVVFPHEAHWGLEGADCLACHHRMEAGKNVLDAASLLAEEKPSRCVDCHGTSAELEAAFHLLCIGCHDRAKFGTEAGASLPRACGDCHPWKR